MKFFPERRKNIYIIVAGCGRLGGGLAASLSLKKRDVLIMDEKEEAFRKLSASYGGLTMCADVSDLGKLEEAGIRRADVFIAVTDKDNVNIMAAQIAKQIYKVRHVLARVYDEEKIKLLEGTGIEAFCPNELSEKEINRFMNWEDNDEN